MGEPLEELFLGVQSYQDPSTPEQRRRADLARRYSHPLEEEEAGGGFDPTEGRQALEIQPEVRAYAPQGQGADPANILAQMSPEQLAALGKPMVLGSTGSSSRTTQTMRPLGPLPARITAQSDKGFEAIKAANIAGAEAQAAGAESIALAQQAADKDMQAKRALVAVEQAKIQARAQEQDEDRKAARERHRQMKVDPGRRWRGAEGVMSKIAFALAAAGQGFVMGMRGQAGPNPILQMMERAIERDIALQQDDIAKAKGQIGELDTIYKETLAEGKSADEAAHQQRMYDMESLKLRLQGMESQATSEVLRQNSKAAAGDVDVRMSKMAEDRYRAGQGRETVSRTSGGTTRRGTLGQMLLPLLKQKQAGQKIVKVDSKRDDRLRKVRVARAAVDAYGRLREKEGMPYGESWLKGKKYVVEEERKKAIDAVIDALMPGATVDQSKLIKGSLGDDATPMRTVRSLAGRLLHDLDVREKSEFESATAAGENIAPLIRKHDLNRAKYGLRYRETKGE